MVKGSTIRLDMTDSADREFEKYTQTVQPFEYVKSQYFLFYNN